MVTGNEYIFPNIDDALAYVLDNEQRALASGRYALKPNLRERKYLFRGETEFHSPLQS